MACSHIDPQHHLFQTTRRNGHIVRFDTLKDAKTASEADPTIFRISFTLQTGERLVLERSGADEWYVAATGTLLNSAKEIGEPVN